MTFCLDESKGVDAGSREEMVAFLTTELADLQYVLAEEAAGEDWGMEGDTASDGLARLHMGMSVVSKSMSSKYSSSKGTDRRNSRVLGSIVIRNS